MSFAVIFLCLSSVQQLQIEPRTGDIGGEFVVATLHADGPAAGIQVEVQLPDGKRRSCGTTALDGALRFHPDQAGYHVFAAEIDGVRCLAPVVVTPERRLWLLAFGTVPLALALAWANLRPRRTQPITRST